MLPVVLRRNAADGLLQFANFTGAQPQRQSPYDKVVLNIRASYRQETLAMVEAFHGAQANRHLSGRRLRRSGRTA
jgi:hypothetical protein